jgi:hypothetical protein
MADHSNLFHEALVKVHDIATNKPFDMQSWKDVREVVDKTLAEARRTDRASIDATKMAPTRGLPGPSG